MSYWQLELESHDQLNTLGFRRVGEEAKQTNKRSMRAIPHKDGTLLECNLDCRKTFNVNQRVYGGFGLHKKIAHF